MVILRKLAFRVQSNLGAHPSKIKNAASLLETTFESFNFHSDMWVRNELHVQPQLRRAQSGLWFFEIALVLVRLDHVASRIVNADYSIMRTAVNLAGAATFLLRAPPEPGALEALTSARE